MRFLRQAIVLAIGVPALFAGDETYKDLWLYQGHWTGTHRIGSSSSPVDIVNDCGRIGRFFGCQQTVAGKVGALVLYVPAEQPGHFYTQAVLPDNRATGRGELTIDGSLWTFQGKNDEGGKVTYFKTTNAFSGKNRIHFELLESPDGEHWVLQSSGDETRVSSRSH